MADILPYWGSFANNNQFDYNPTDTAAGRAFLEAVRQYDPTAGFTAHQMGGEGGSGQNYYTFNGDLSKVPGYQSNMVDLNQNSFDPQYYSPFGGGASTGHSFAGTLIDPSKTSDSGLLGRTTTQDNIFEPKWGSDVLDWAGPLGVLGFGIAMGGIPSLYSGVFGQGAYGGGGASGLGASDPFLQGGTGAMDMTGSAGTGIPGSFGANAPLGSAESSLYGADALTNPAGALGGSGAGAGASGGLTQAQWDEIIAGQPENGSFVGPNGTDVNGFSPQDYRDLEAFNAGLDNPSLADRIRNAINPSNLSKIPGLLGAGAGAGGGGSGGGGGGGNLLINAGGQQQKPQVEDAAAILAKLYGYGARNG